MPSFEALSWSSLKKFSPLAVDKDSLDYILKPSKVSDYFCVTVTQLEKEQFTIIKIFLSVHCTMADERNIFILT